MICSRSWPETIPAAKGLAGNLHDKWERRSKQEVLQPQRWGWESACAAGRDPCQLRGVQAGAGTKRSSKPGTVLAA